MLLAKRKARAPGTAGTTEMPMVAKALEEAVPDLVTARTALLKSMTKQAEIRKEWTDSGESCSGEQGEPDLKKSQESGGTKHLRGCDETGEPLFFEW